MAARTALIADDEPLLLRLMARVLKRQGWEVLTAPDGAEAVRIYADRGGEIGVAILDAAILPNGAGEILEAFDDGAPSVVLTSGDALDADLAATLRERSGAFLRKPFAPDALLRAVQACGAEPG